MTRGAVASKAKSCTTLRASVVTRHGSQARWKRLQENIYTPLILLSDEQYSEHEVSLRSR